MSVIKFWDICACFVTEDLAHLGLMLGRFLLMAQAAFLDRQFFDLLPPFNDGRVTPEVDIGGRNVAKTLMVALSR